jgi:peptidyl-prolyl cis-trans isomerase C
MRMLTRLLAVVLVPSLVACGGPVGGKREKTLAVVNGEAITEGDFRREAEGLPPYMQPILETPSGRQQFLESLITRDLLLQEARRRGVDRRAEVRSRLDGARKTIVLEALLREVAEGAPGLSEEALRRHYEENRESFEVGERVLVRHILFSDPSEAESAARRAEKGEPFERLMREAEEAGYKAGDLGFVEKGDVDKDFEEAAFDAPTGSVAGPVRTIYGYHLLQVLERRPAGLQPFEEVREKIAADLREGAQREAFESLVDGLRQRSRITLHEAPGAVPSASWAPDPGIAAGGERDDAIREEPLPGNAAPGGGR